MYITTLVLLFIVVALLLPRCARIRRSKHPLSVNYHFTRQCNKTCGFCFHTASTSHIESIENAKHGLSLLKEAGMRKLNFAGGEPFLYPKFLGEAVDFCKEVLCLESVSIVTNGSLVKETFLVKHGHNIDILAISCDSFNEATNKEIGRGSGDHVKSLYQIRDLCRKYGIKFKINTVVCKLNFQEDMNKYIEDLAPFRWKCFQVLLVSGENDSTETKRDARKFLITDEEFNLFCVVHRQQKSFVPESNTLMAKSYLILDEYMRFLDRDGRQPSAPILKVGVRRALDSVYWDEKSFVSRGGIYDWKRDQVACPSIHRDVEW
ncbi:radical SAM enzyme [Aspergillus alliaceus]|uniref:radical SAM enzyme n=1 Tax=Petromyces alliaceus TaxID=209559 RepID=UPI0012A47DBC|nr:radical SAM enzyme [Aspergillus alliaceus]KAB8231213.1 radical SAM enzyme [Aspergillus alliaceus]